MNKKTIALLNSLMLIIALSCHKKTSEPTPTTQTCRMLTSRLQSALDTIPNNSINVYTYNAQNRLYQILTNDTVTHVSSVFVTLNYDSAGRVNKIMYGSPEVTDYDIYTYNSNNMLATDTSYGIVTNSQTSPVYAGYGVYTYDNLNRVARYDGYTNLNMSEPNNTPPNFSHYSYITYEYDDKGNVLQSTQTFIAGGPPLVTNYTYDNNPKFISDYDKVANYPVSPNNVILETFTGNGAYTSEKTTYTYNADNYPAKAISGTDTTYYTYSCN